MTYCATVYCSASQHCCGWCWLKACLYIPIWWKMFLMGWRGIILTAHWHAVRFQLNVKYKRLSSSLLAWGAIITPWLKKKKCKNGGRDYNLYIKAENENRGRQTRRLEKQEDKDRNGVEFGWHGRHRPTDTTSAVASRLRTLFAEFGEEAEACDGWPGEDDGVLARDVLAELLGHKAVELRLVLQGGQTICTLTVLQVDWDLSSARTENTYIKQI